jgi:hypothetical protein
MAAAVQLKDAVFDPAATHVMGEAFDCVCRLLRGIGQVDSVREIIATRIIEVLKRLPLTFAREKRALKSPACLVW